MLREAFRSAFSSGRSREPLVKRVVRVRGPPQGCLRTPRISLLTPTPGLRFLSIGVKAGLERGPMTETETVQKAKAANREAFGDIVAQHSPRLAQLASWYLDERDVDDVLQEIWASVYRKLWQLEDDSRLLPWLKTITFRTCMDYRKARAVRLRAETVLQPESWSAIESYVSDDGSSLDEILETRELRQVLSRELDRLPGTYGLLLRLRYLRDLSYQEISDAAGIPANLVKQRLHQGREILRSRLA